MNAETRRGQTKAFQVSARLCVLSALRGFFCLVVGSNPKATADRGSATFIRERSLCGDVAVLSDSDILSRLGDGSLGIEPFSESSLTPNGYDLRIAEVMLPDVDPAVHREGKIVVPPHTRFLVSTLERVRMPADVCAQLWIRSSYARRGVLGSFGKVEAGFMGTLTVGGFNASSAAVELPVGDRFCQIVFERLESPPRALYAERSGNYQGQSGITMARDRP